jgi:hypothetical protein
VIKFNYFPLAMVLLSCAPAVMGQDASDAQWQAFYVKLGTVIRGGVKGADSPLKVILQVPGTPLEAVEKPTASDKAYINRLFDFTLQNGPIYDKKGGTISSFYKKILYDTEPITTGTLSKEEQKELEGIQDKLTPGAPGELISKYDECEQADIVARATKQAEQEASLENGGDGMASALANAAVTKADSDWKNIGKKATVLALQKRFDELTNRDPRARWTTLQKQMEKYFLEGTDSYNILTFPPQKSWVAPTGWMKFTYKNSDQTKSSSSSSLDTAAAVSLNVGKFKGSGSGSYAKAESEALAKDKSLEITMEMKRVFLYRPWLDPAVFLDKNWRWQSGKDLGWLADNQGNGDLGLITDSFILVRNVRFHAASLATFKKKMTERIQAKLEASYGPFSMSASMDKKKASASSGKTEDATTIEIPDPQIIGYTATILSVTPLSKGNPPKKK